MSEQEVKYAAFVEQDKENNLGRLVNSCDELRYFLQHPEANRIIAKHHENEILTYATSFSPYYSLFSGFKSLRDFPIVSKQDLKDHWDEIAVLQLASDPNICTKFTSGSTGTPFKMILDKYKHARWIAGNKIFRENVGVKSHEKTVFVSETVKDKHIPQERMDRDNVYYFFLPYLDDVSLTKFIADLQEQKVRTMTALASIYDAIARWIVRGKAPVWKGDFLAVFSVSEPLKETTRKIISDYFNLNKADQNNLLYYIYTFDRIEY